MISKAFHNVIHLQELHICDEYTFVEIVHPQVDGIHASVSPKATDLSAL